MSRSVIIRPVGVQKGVIYADMGVYAADIAAAALKLLQAR